MKRRNIFKKQNVSKKIAFSFFIVIFIGAFLLMLPISNQNGLFLHPVDALFTATSATCVTGLVTIVPASQFTLFGKIVLIVLMQIGGIGLMTLVASFIFLLKNRLSLNDKIALKEMLNQSEVVNFRNFLNGILRYTFIVEGIGFILLSFVFIPEYGWCSGSFISLFTTVSAFCNAGFDIIGDSSLISYVGNEIVNFTVMGLIICGGIGFAVWFDVKDKVHKLRRKEMTLHRFFTSFTLHTKLVLIMTFILIFVPAILFFILEYNHAFLDLSLWDKIQASLFTSVTLRTAGFATIPMGECVNASKLLMMIVMFIGGSPGGTAGGIKTTTVAVIALCVYRSLKGKNKTNVFHRHISRDIIVRATTIFAINITVLFTGIFFLTIVEDKIFIDLAYEAVSALATVGLTLGITSILTMGGKLIIILLMFVGRIGIMTFIMSFIKEDNKDDILEYAEGHVIVG